MSEDAYRRERIRHWSGIASRRLPWGGARGAYQRRLAEIYRLTIPPGQRVLEVGCETGDLLASLRPSFGVGIDFSHAAVREARRRHPGLSFVEADAHALPLAPSAAFDFIVLSDLVNDLWDVQRVLEELAPLVGPRTRLVLNFFSHLWEYPLRAASRLGAAQSTLRQNWLTPDDVRNLLRLANLDVVRDTEEVLFPLDVPLLAPFFNKLVVHVWPFRHLALAHVMTVRSSSSPPPAATRSTRPSVSVVVPARNEAGNIEGSSSGCRRWGARPSSSSSRGTPRTTPGRRSSAARERHPESPARPSSRPARARATPCASASSRRRATSS